MSTIVQATTPEITILIPGVDLTDKSRIEVYIASTKTTLVFSDERVRSALSEEGTLLFVVPTQHETMAMEKGKTMEVQVRWMDEDGNVSATDVSGKLEVERILHRHEMKVR